jgi:hypothetical protein
MEEDKRAAHGRLPPTCTLNTHPLVGMKASIYPKMLSDIRLFSSLSF